MEGEAGPQIFIPQVFVKLAAIDRLLLTNRYKKRRYYSKNVYPVWISIIATNADDSNEPKMSLSTKVQMLEIDAEDAGQRLDNFLIRILKGLPKSRIYRIIRKGEVRINGKRCRPDSRLGAGDKVRVPPIQRLAERSTAVGNFKNLEELVIYEDDRLLIVNKPAGMAVHGGSGVSVGVIESLRHVREEGDRLELVHRLDRGTSGCLMVAKKRSYLRLLQDALRKPGQIRKHYLALVHGNWSSSHAVIDEPLLTTNKAGKERVTRVNPDGKAAKTEFARIASDEEISLIRAYPVTGRTHQIRVHARWARHPILGDDRYGSQELDRHLSYSGRMLLHARELMIPALDGFPTIEAMAPLDDTFQVKVDSRFGDINY